MSPGRIVAGRARAVRVVVALAAVSACLGAVAFAATHPEGPAPALGESEPVRVAPQQGGGGPQGKEEERLLRPRFIEYPETVSATAEAQFRFHVPPRPQATPRPGSGPPGEVTTARRRFQCKLDDGEWRSCSSPYRLTALALGAHAFAVRAFNRADRAGPTSTYSWQQVERASPAQRQVDPMPFSIELRAGLEDLYPGYPAQQVPIQVTNPNPVTIEVTSLIVGIDGDPPACPSENFVLTPSSASPTAPLIVPAGASLSLPTATASAPTIGMINLPVNQDACRGAEVPLVFSGEAHG